MCDRYSGIARIKNTKKGEEPHRVLREISFEFTILRIQKRRNRKNYSIFLRGFKTKEKKNVKSDKKQRLRLGRPSYKFFSAELAPRG